MGCGCTERTDAGFGDFGVAVVGRLKELGMLIDTSHCGRQTTLDAAAVSTRPVTCSHTAARALRDIPRNKRDDELRATAATGGGGGGGGVSSFLPRPAPGDPGGNPGPPRHRHDTPRGRPRG